ncbi:TolC family protein [Tundrisphaera sp. TA3]|uniref:TolC family protein n=1 Tax=Tundrisphaera sp. TA3 TaxID=3435775 RepID=UPI003EB999D2
MIARMRWLAVFLAACGPAGSRPAAAQGVPDPTSSPRLGLPFGTEPDRLSGPPRAVGELPIGESQPPSTLPGNLSGPPRAVGESPPGTPGSPGAAGASGGASPFGLDRPSPVLPLSPSNPFTGMLPGGFFLGAQRPESAPGTTGDAAPTPPSSASVGIGGGPPLDLEEIVGSALQSYPPFLAVLEERGIAAGDLLSARGAFDLNLNADTRNYPLGYYRRSVHDVFIDQPLRVLGSEVFAGYRLAEGRWPTYYNYLNTRGGGAFVAGFKLPLLKNRDIDARRAKEFQAEIERRKVEPTILKERISLVKNITKAYWAWVGTGQAVAVYRDLIRLAEFRGKSLEAQVNEQLIRPIDIVDFRRVLLSRQQQLVAMERRFRQAGIELSLFYRDGRCLPIIPDPSRVPEQFPTQLPPSPEETARDLEVALRLRPEILGLRLQAQKAQVERQYAENQTLPSLSLYVYTEQNVGNRTKDLGSDFRPYVAETSLLFDVPLQRRYARGRIAATDGVIRQLAHQTRFASDRIQADILDAESAVQTAWGQLVRYREYEDQTRSLQRAEAALLREGSSTVLLLNLREQATSDARASRIEAEAKLFSALADYRAAVGLDSVYFDPPQPPNPATVRATN